MSREVCLGRKALSNSAPLRHAVPRHLFCVSGKPIPSLRFTSEQRLVSTSNIWVFLDFQYFQGKIFEVCVSFAFAIFVLKEVSFYWVSYAHFLLATFSMTFMKINMKPIGRRKMYEAKFNMHPLILHWNFFQMKLEDFVRFFFSNLIFHCTLEKRGRAFVF